MQVLPMYYFLCTMYFSHNWLQFFDIFEGESWTLNLDSEYILSVCYVYYMQNTRLALTMCIQGNCKLSYFQLCGQGVYLE